MPDLRAEMAALDRLAYLHEYDQKSEAAPVGSKMLRPSKKLALALEAVVDIAFHGTLEPVQSQAVANRLELPKRYLEQVLQHLVKGGILKGVRGPKGGYRLARERRRITAAEIVSVVQGIEDKTEISPASSSEIGRHVMNPLWQKLEDEIIAELRNVTVDDLCKRAEGLVMIDPKNVPEPLDFII